MCRSHRLLSTVALELPFGWMAALCTISWLLELGLGSRGVQIEASSDWTSQFFRILVRETRIWVLHEDFCRGHKRLDLVLDVPNDLILYNET